MRLDPGDPESNELSLTPLIDVVFMLLIFFLVATTFAKEEVEMDLTLPEAATGEEGEDGHLIVINVKHGGELFVDGRQVTLEALRQKLGAAARRNNDQEVLNMITTDALCRWYLEKRYWPAIYKVSAAGKNALPAPHSKMATAIRANLKGEKLPILLREVLQHEPRWNNPLPSLKSRIVNIGHNKPLVSNFSGDTAGTHYLGKSLDGVVAVIDKLWRNALINKYKRQSRQSEMRVARSQATSSA